MEIQAFELRAMLNDAAVTAVEKFAVEIGALKANVSLAQAYRMYGRQSVDTWIRKGLIKGIKKGNNTSKVEFDRIELRLLAKTDNRAVYQ